VEENLWRAIRHGLDGRMIDFDRREEVPTAAAIERLVAWTEPARTELGIDLVLPERNGTQRSRDAIAAGATIQDVYRAAVEETWRTYVPQAAPAPAE